MSLETICPLKAFQLHYCPDNDVKSMLKHLIFPSKICRLMLFHDILALTNMIYTNKGGYRRPEKSRKWESLFFSACSSVCASHEVHDGIP